MKCHLFWQVINEFSLFQNSMAPQAAPSLVHFICRTRSLLHPSVAMKNSDDECPGGAVAMENANVATAVRDLFMLNDDD